MKIYTKTGDSGQTGLLDGSRVDKNHIRCEMYGLLDELNSFLGVPLSLGKNIGLEIIQEIQSALFNLGSHLALPGGDKSGKLPGIPEELVSRMEKKIDLMDGELLVLKAFILPGGGILSGHLHIARAVSRRAERFLIGFYQEFPLEKNPQAVIFLNRLSDLLFTMARFANLREGIEDIPWKS